ncbi:GtrA family protein [Ligilactobacillus ceti]|uniref:GtcA family membrane protein n=1 Tax=Ligilactobacillus ceti DSM 22408 TaxID=1122146 RepID=A0A0R2KLP9_9LACO|nr:GtrA family protein [Ligilactobacillus ceti]KRN90370.1 GtcA family membrane protein [Ligilactobacillus ceti DSM 22408]
MNKLLKKYHNFLSYTLYGTLASLINLLVFHILTENLNMFYLVSNVIAYVIAMIFTFITNKKYVFHSQFRSWSDTWQEFLSFVNIRLFSFILDTVIMFVGVHFIVDYPNLIKVIDLILVGILNYYFSKWFIFHTTEKISWRELKQKTLKKQQ